MFPVSQVSGEKRVQNGVEDSDAVGKRKREIIVIDEDSDSHNGSSVIQVSSSSKRLKVDYNSGPTSFKGVVLLRNGHWGAQIYVNLQRIWLGTFRSEKEAAMAYDSAAIKLLGSSSSSVHSHRNIPLTNITVHEPGFQSQFKAEEVLKMIKEDSYMSKFYDYLKEQSLEGQKPSVHKDGECGFFCKKLFEKELTPSDVGSLNRLVIPKKFAMMHLHGTVPHHQGGDQSMDSEVVCYDRLNMEWKFRFCYWKSSQSFVFTRGWNAFIKANNLKAKDTLLFFTCQCPSDKTTTTTKFGIDVQHYDDKTTTTTTTMAGIDVQHYIDKTTTTITSGIDVQRYNDKTTTTTTTSGIDVQHYINKTTTTTSGIDVQRYNDKTTTTTTFGIDVQDYNQDYNDEQNNALEKEDALLHIIENEKDLSQMDSNGSSKQKGFRLFGRQIIV